MTNLELIKPNVYTIKIKDKELQIKFTLESFAYLEEKFGSLNEAIALFNEKNHVAVVEFLEAGLLHCKKKTDIEKILKKADLKELLTKIAQTIRSSLSSDFGFDKEFDFAMLYFIAKPALNFSNEEFWSSTPKTILTMLRMIGEVKGLGKEFDKADKITSQNEAVKAFMGW